MSNLAKSKRSNLFNFPIYHVLNNLDGEFRREEVSQLIPNDNDRFIRLFKSDLAECGNYFECCDFIQKYRQDYRIKFFDCGRSKTEKVKFQLYLNQFETRLIHYFDNFSEQKKANTSYNPHTEIFNFNLCQLLGEKIRKVESSIVYRIERYLEGNEQANQELMFLRYLKYELTNVNNFLDNPSAYIKLLDESSSKFNEKKPWSKTFVQTLKILHHEIYHQVILRNEPRQGFKQFNVDITSGMNEQKRDAERQKIQFYSEIRRSHKFYATWGYSKNYVHSFISEIHHIKNDFYPVYVMKNFFMGSQISMTNDFIKSICKKAHELCHDKNKNPKLCAFEYIELLFGKIVELRNPPIQKRIYYNNKTAVLKALEKHLFNYIEFLIREYRTKFGTDNEDFDRNDEDLLRVIATYIYPQLATRRKKNQDGNYEIKTSDRFLKNTSMIKQLIKGAKDKLPKNDSKNESEKQNPNSITKIIAKETIIEFKKIESKESVLKESEQISNHPGVGSFHSEFKIKLRAWFLTIMMMQVEGFQQQNSPKARDAKKIADAAGSASNLLPCVGTVLSGVVEATGDHVISYLNEKQLNLSANHAKALNIESIDIMSNFIANKICQIYEKQIELISPVSYEQLINVMMERMLTDIGDQLEILSFEQKAIRAIITSTEQHKALGWYVAYIMGKYDRNLFQGKDYTAEGLLASGGIVVYDDHKNPTYYGHRNDEKKYLKYGFRQGSLWEVKHLRQLSTDELKECNPELLVKHQLTFSGYTKLATSQRTRDLSHHQAGADFTEERMANLASKNRELHAKNQSLQNQVDRQNEEIKALKQQGMSQDERLAKLERLLLHDNAPVINHFQNPG